MEPPDALCWLPPGSPRWASTHQAGRLDYSSDRKSSSLRATEELETNMTPIFTEFTCGHRTAFIDGIPEFHTVYRVPVGVDGVIRLTDNAKCSVCLANDKAIAELARLQAQAEAAKPQAVPETNPEAQQAPVQGQ
jgi:hypothetical protein